MAALPERAVSKSKFAMFLRTQCDRELYLSLFSNNVKNLQAAGIPVPLKSRPGVQLITTSGRDFEYEQYDILISKLPKYIIHNKNGRANIDLTAALKGATAPMLILNGLLWYWRPNASLWLLGSLSLGVAWGFLFQRIITREQH